MQERKFTHCPNCNIEINQAYGRGLAKKYCSDSCREEANLKKPPKEFGPCTIDGCSGKATRLSLYCEMHYFRRRRNGTFTNLIRPEETSSSHGYVLAKVGDRPIGTGLRQYKHRIVFYDAHGLGPFNCHWCSKDVTWATMHIDHVDANKKNNHISNLVASCPSCNISRGTQSMIETVRKKQGVMVDGQLRTITEWARIYGISHTSIMERLRKGWSIERAIKEPRGKYGPRSKSKDNQTP